MKPALLLSILFLLFLNKTDAQVTKSVDAFFSPSKFHNGLDYGGVLFYYPPC